ncbi:MAG: hypothetical protein IH899_01215 [Planctomycetes bacterium]|nr:hypothetical protein [Planctomycetota bacterium]
MRRMWAVVGLPLVVLCLGCNGSSTDSTNNTKISSSSASTNSACREQMKRSLEMLEPDRLGISADSETAVAQLNDWLERCAEKSTDSAALGADIQKLLQPVLSPQQLNRLSSGRFVDGDGEHIRNCLLHKVLANLEFESAETELGRSVQVFHYIPRNIALAPASSQTLPLPPYEILLLGRGTAKDIAWVFADVLRQLKIDTVILGPAGSVAGETATSEQRRWLVGVLLDEHVYLFDPQIGSPIPSPLDTGQTPTVQRPATLAEVLKDDRILRDLDFSSEQPYPLYADDLRQLKVEVVGTTSSWSSSMQRLQAALSGNGSAVVYDGLQDDTDSVGLISRVANFGGQYWGKDDVAVWQYPESQLEAFEHLDETQRQLLALWQLPLGAPVAVGYNPQTRQITIGQPENGQLKTRTMHLLGDYRTAIGNYVKIRMRHARINPRLPIPPKIRLMHARAEDDAFFWMGLSQFEQGHLEAATSTFRDYLRRYAQQPNAAWPAHCRSMLALSLAESGDVSAAVDELKNELKKADLAARLRDRYQFWIRRWSAIQPSPRNGES